MPKKFRKPAREAASPAVGATALNSASAATRWFPLLLILFAGSGCSALIYEIVWYQMLQLVIGSTAISLAVLLATFMGGLCLGSLVLPRIRSAADRHPLFVYAVVEAGIGFFGLLALIGMPLVDRIYVAAVGHGMPAVFFRATICAICLLPPTFLMGASLPAASRWVKATARGVSWLGLLYGANIAGAVFGCLLAGFYLLRVFNLTAATLVAAAINAIVAFVSYSLSKVTPAQSVADSPADVVADEAASESDAGSEMQPAPSAGRPTIYVAIALSGATALGAEVVWTRLLGLMLGATVYAFSIILAVFLVGLGSGSFAGAALARRARPQAALGYCQLFLAAAVFWTAFMLAKSVPYWPINPLLTSSPWFTFQIDLARVIWTVFPATLLWGASFPLALAAASRASSRRDESDSAALVGGVYAANTAGAIVGSLAFSLILIPHVGTRDCERILIWVSIASAALVLIPVILASRGKILSFALLLAATAGASFLAVKTEGVPPGLIAYGRRFMLNINNSEILYTGEGLNSSIAISRYSDGALQFHVSGKVEASTESYDMRLQRSLGHMAALAHRDPHSVLIVGFGAGVTAGTFVTYPGIQRIVICEMEPLVPPIATEYFAPENYDVMNDPRTKIVYDDARHFVLTTNEKFDIITSDPIHPWVKGSATLYSREYFEMVKAHLNPGGVVTQWVPLYESDVDTVRSELATFFSVFPYGTVWANQIEGRGYDIFLMGQVEPPRFDLDALQARFNSPEYARVANSLHDVGFNSPLDLFSIYSGNAADLQPWLAGAEINRDGNLRLQYLAGLALNQSMEDEIFGDIIRYRRFPDAMFTGSPAMRQQLMYIMRGGAQQ
jgi:spermidine synthase